MSSGSSCHFCARANPAGSKFCNDCGEPLDLKPCSHCDAFNHVAVDSIGAAHPQPPPTRPFRVDPMLDPLERIPVALSDRLEARTERVAERASEAPPPLMPFAEAPDPDVDADVDWVDPRQQRAARLESSVRRRARAAYAATATLVLCAVAAAGYVAYDTGLLSPATDWAGRAGRSIVAASAAMIGEVRGARPGERADPSPPPTAAASGGSESGIAQSDSGTASPDGTSPRPGDGATRSGGAASAPADARTPVAAPTVATSPAEAPTASEAPAPLATRTLGDTSQASAAAMPPSRTARVERFTPGNARQASRATTETANKASRSARQDSAHAIARQAPRGPSSAAAAQPPVDKDAIATRRLIERDLAGFLPHLPNEPPPPR
jgi:hypothetical protein